MNREVRMVSLISLKCHDRIGWSQSYVMLFAMAMEPFLSMSESERGVVGVYCSIE